MNFKKQAKKLEYYLEEEFKKNAPILELDNGSVIYKTFKIKKNKQEEWDLLSHRGDVIDTFKLKVTAIVAANCYIKNNFKKYSEIKLFDKEYWINSVDSSFLNLRYKQSTDYELKDFYYSRWLQADSKSKIYKNKIVDIFRRTF